MSHQCAYDDWVLLHRSLSELEARFAHMGGTLTPDTLPQYVAMQASVLTARAATHQAFVRLMAESDAVLERATSSRKIV